MSGHSGHFTVVDLETTGLFARGVDRIIEIAMVRVDSAGMILDEYCTLVNPNRDIGPTRIHGIEAWELAGAPAFEDILGDVASRLQTSVAVGHLATFDLGFISAEFDRADCPLPTIQYVCTLDLAKSTSLELPSRKLEALCECFDIPLPRAHSALEDAKATAALFSHLVATVARDDPVARRSLAHRVLPGTGSAWPNRPPSGRRCLRGEQRCPVEGGADLIARLVGQLPLDSTVTDDVQEYLGLLDRVLEDRRVTAEEGDRLYDLAVEMGLSRADAAQAHVQYLGSLIARAWEDGVISEFESRDLATAARLLSVSDADLHILMKSVAGRPAPTRPSASTQIRDLSGQLVCFTGELRGRLKGQPIDRAFAERIAADHGMIVKSGVSRKLDLLVAADPDSNSGKAKKAREYGIRIITEATFWQMMGVQVE